MIKLSIIVPVYNVAPYLRKCVDSLLAQDISDYEIILVDDGSIDNSGAICDEYATIRNPQSTIHNRQSTIKVIHQKNGGLSAARNSGIKVAQGKYLMFVDSDDYIEPNVLGALMEQVEKEELDVLRYNYQNVRVVDALHLDAERLTSTNLEYEVFEPNKTPHRVDTRSEIVDGETYLNTRMGYACYAWQFILRRDLIVNPLTLSSVHSFFTPGLHFEDIDWMPRMMLCAKRVNSTSMIVYNYFARQGSITQVQGNNTKIRKNTMDRMAIIANLVQLQSHHPNCQWIGQMYSGMVIDVLIITSRSLYSERYEYIKSLKSMNVFPLTLTNQNLKYTLYGVIANISPCLAVRCMHLKYRFF